MMAIDYEFTGRASADAHLAAGAVCDAMESMGVDQVSRDVIDLAARSLGDGWDFKAVEACIGNCSFGVVEV
jgi:hypothetical protein